MTPPRTVRRSSPEVVAPAAIALLGWFALLTELTTSLHHSLAMGRGLPEALFLYLRFFTILTNIYVAALMSVTAWRLMRGASAPRASLFAAALVYILVVSVTYEALLRGLWSPHGLSFYTDLILHDVVPGLVLCHWILLAPKAGIRWHDPLQWLEFPAVYFAATLIAGVAGAGYPYDFLDVAALGYAGVIVNGLAFLACFYLLGLGITVAARARSRRTVAATEPPARTAG